MRRFDHLLTVAPHDAGIRASSLLRGALCLPQSLLQKFFRLAKFRRSPAPAAGSAVLLPSSTLAAGESVVCVDAALAAQLAARRAPAAAAAAPPPPRLPSAPLPVRCRTAALLVVSKAAGAHSQDPRSGVLASLAALETAEGAPAGSLRLVHRLDTPVGGLLCLARTLDAARRLSAALRGDGGAAASFHRAYVGLVLNGAAAAPFGVLTGAVNGGQPASTRWRVAAEGRAACGARLTALLLAPQTGRKHQLRQHAAALAGPLFNDTLYGAPPGAALGRAIGLHAAAMRIAGAGGDSVEVVDELPERWAPFLARHGVDAAALRAQLLPFLREEPPAALA